MPSAPVLRRELWAPGLGAHPREFLLGRPRGPWGGSAQPLSSAQPQDDYSVLFEDTSYADGYSPPLNVAQRYVVACKEPKKK